jgi:carboxyl-terminal processing protease
MYKIWMNMKIRNAILMTAVASVALIAAFCPKPTPVEKEAVLLQKMMEVMNQLHYNPQTNNDELSKKVFKLYLDRSDAGRRFLTQGDVDKMKAYELQLDDHIKTQDFTFFNQSVELMDAATVKAETFYKEVLTETIDFTKNETIELDGDKKPYAKDDKELKDIWRRMIKFEVLTRLTSKLEDKEKGKAEVKDKSEEELQKAAMAETTKNYNEYFKRIKKVKRMDRLSNFLNAITSVYDPHTEYFEPIDKQSFDISMSGRLIGIGARLQTDSETDFTKISDIIIGGPAWKQGDLKEGDLVTKVAQVDKEPVSVAGMDINEVVSMIRGEAGTEVRLTVKSKADGSTKVISIIREEVILDEGYAKSLVIQSNKDSEKIGYIKLPKFYADFEKEDGHQCAEDVEVEIEKLKKANVKGIILDLRNNGGGSLRDVVKMSGFFVEEGPMVQVKNRFDKAEVLNDSDPSVQYTGPLVVMVNEFSASASEILAAAMQDYGRAVIVGSNTYGKGTVQRFFDLDRALVGNNSVKPLGQIKITIQKFFRVNGGSTQLKGVAPDIALPDNYTEIPVGEKDNEHPMAWTQINPVKFGQTVVDLKKLPKIAESSKKRVDANPTFKLIAENAVRIKQQRDDTDHSLNLKAYRDSEAKRKELNKKFDSISKPITIEGFTAENLSEDMAALTASNDSSKVIRNTDWVKDVKKDIHLYETLMIMKDLIQNATFKTASVEPKRK